VPATAASITALLERELSALSDPRVVAHIRSLLVTPRCETRPWDYGRPDEGFPCWIVLKHSPTNSAVAFCEHGFGPAAPWGLLRLEGTEHMSMGMDSGWFRSFLEAYFDSKAVTELPIWRVFQHQGTNYPGRAITAEGSWDDTWAEVMRLRETNDGFRYDCEQCLHP
jgi:hypothetical protein